MSLLSLVIMVNVWSMAHLDTDAAGTDPTCNRSALLTTCKVAI